MSICAYVHTIYIIVEIVLDLEKEKEIETNERIGM